MKISTIKKFINNYKIQLVPQLINIKSNVKSIKCLSFYDDKIESEFFPFNPSSEFKFYYRLSEKIDVCPEKITLQFSNLSYHENKWYFFRRKFGFTFLFVINENDDSITINNVYHNLFIKIGWLVPIGYIITDYITYKLEKSGKNYFSGAAAHINDKTFLFFGYGRNFKTTLVNEIMELGGYYIGEEFFLLNENNVYATIPNKHNFDFRISHKKLFAKDLKNKKIDISEYNVVLFLILSCKDQILEINQEKANKYAKHYHHIINTYYYRFFKARDFLLGNTKNQNSKKLLTNGKARYFLVYFTDIKNVVSFIKKYDLQK